MSNHYNRLAVSSEYSAVNFLPATLKTNKSGWLIEYYVENPQTPKTWIELRKKLDIPQKMQMYSFRDTGISEMIKNGIDPLSVKQLANHSSLDITTIYTNHADPNLRNIIIPKTPSFSHSHENKGD